MHLPPPPAPPPSGAAPTAGATHRTAKIESVGCGAGSNGDASVKRRSGVRETDGDATHGRECACARREGRPRQRGTAAPITITWRPATALPTAARARPRAPSTRPLRNAPTRSAVRRPRSIATLHPHRHAPDSPRTVPANMKL